MPFQYMARMADLKVNGFGDDMTPPDIAKAIVDYFKGQDVTILAIQQCANRTAHVTFEERTACAHVQSVGKLDMGGVKVPVVSPPPPPSNWVN